MASEQVGKALWVPKGRLAFLTHSMAPLGSSRAGWSMVLCGAWGEVRRRLMGKALSFILLPLQIR